MERQVLPLGRCDSLLLGPLELDEHREVGIGTSQKAAKFRFDSLGILTAPDLAIKQRQALPDAHPSEDFQNRPTKPLRRGRERCGRERTVVAAREISRNSGGSVAAFLDRPRKAIYNGAIKTLRPVLCLRGGVRKKAPSP